MRRLVDHVLCSLPFEETWFREHGCNATFVGHPFFDEVRRQQLDEPFLARLRRQPGPLVTILPGSRTQEVTHNLPWFLKAAAHVRGGSARACGSPWPRSSRTRRRSPGSRRPQAGLPIEVYVGKTPELIRLAECCMAVSGSVSLELLYHTKPTVILYWISRLAYLRAGVLPQGEVHHAGQPAGGRRAVPRGPDAVRPAARKRPIGCCFPSI